MNCKVRGKRANLSGLGVLAQLDEEVRVGVDDQGVVWEPSQAFVIQSHCFLQLQSVGIIFCLFDEF